MSRNKRHCEQPIPVQALLPKILKDLGISEKELIEDGTMDTQLEQLHLPFMDTAQTLEEVNQNDKVLQTEGM